MCGNITVDRYFEPEYDGKSGTVIDSNGKLRNVVYNEVLYYDICEWFRENNVSHEVIGIDINFLSDIEDCIVSKGFIPYYKDSSNIFLDKYKDYFISKETLEKIYVLYIKNMQRTDSKTFDEIMSEIDEEIGNGLGESEESQEQQKVIFNRKQDLAMVFMKYEEKKLLELNNLIEDCLHYRVNGINYDLLYRCALIMFRDLKIEDYNFEKITKSSDIEDSKKIALDFFKSIDEELYQKVKSIVEGNSAIGFETYKFDDSNNTRPRASCVSAKSGKPTVYISYKESVEDIYVLVHELSHTFDWDPKENKSSTWQMLGEVTPFCFEYMLDYYLIQHGIVDKKDVANRQKARIIDGYNCGMNTFAKIELMKIKEKRYIEEKDILELQQIYKLTDKQVKFILNDLLHSTSNAHFDARYMIAQLICLSYIKQYNENSYEAIKTLKEYFELVKQDDYMGGLKKVGVNVEPNEMMFTIEQLVADVSKRLEEVDGVRNNDRKAIDEFMPNSGNLNVGNDGDIDL